MGRTQGPGSHEPYQGPERRHQAPCGGLVEIQIASARADAQLEGIESHFARQNGSIQRIEAKVEHLDARIQAGVEDRQQQIDGVQKQASNNHAAILDRLATRDRQMVVFLIGVLVIMRAPEIRALGDTIIKLFGG